MDNKIEEIGRLLHQAAETHHYVFAFSDGDDPDWASWYSNWLVNLSALQTPDPRYANVKVADPVPTNPRMRVFLSKVV
jgi:hypothetical protein